MLAPVLGLCDCRQSHATLNRDEPLGLLQITVGRLAQQMFPKTVPPLVDTAGGPRSQQRERYPYLVVYLVDEEL